MISGLLTPATGGIALLVVLTGIVAMHWRGGDEAAEESGEAVGKTIAWAGRMYWSLVSSFFLGVIRYLPGRGSLSKGLIVGGHKLILRKYDAIVHVVYGDGVVIPRPATWESEEMAFKTNNDEWFSAKGIGFDPKRLHGKVPVVWALRDSHEITEPLESPIARAAKLGRFQGYEHADGGPDVAVDIDPNNFDAGTSGAVADGGQSKLLDGTVTSFREGYEMFGSKVDQEDMRDQEKRGKLAAMQVNSMGDNWKYILAILGAFALGLFGPSLASQIAGSASGMSVPGGLGSFGLIVMPALGVL